MNRRTLLALLALPTAVHADEPTTARAVARAGANLVAIDDGSALLTNPAGLARRSRLRLELGLTLSTQSVSFRSDRTFGGLAPPTVESRGGIAALPWGGGAVGLGEHVVVGAAFLQPLAQTYRYPAPDRAFEPARDDRATATARYAATQVELRRWGLGIGAAVRVLPWLALGASALVLRSELVHGRTLWGGPTAELALEELSPAYDMAFEASGSAWSPALGASAIAAPPDLPLEFAASVLWQPTPTLSGHPRLSSSRNGAIAATVIAAATSAIELPEPLRLRAGARLLAGRVIVELDGELALAATAAPAWRITGVEAIDANGVGANLGAVRLGPVLESSFSVRAGLDLELVRGQVALLAGYGFTYRTTSDASLGPALPRSDGHTAAFGVEGRVGDATVTLGVAHTFRPARAADSLDNRVIAPFGPIGPPASSGRLESSATMVALDVEFELN